MSVPERLDQDLDDAWEVLGEAYQTVMRRYGIVDAYQRLKVATRGKRVDRASLHALIEAQEEIPLEVKNRLKELTPRDYLGKASELALLQ